MKISFYKKKYFIFQNQFIFNFIFELFIKNNVKK